MRPASALPSLDLKTLARVYQSREVAPQDLISLLLERIAAYPDPAVWIHLLHRDDILAQVRAVEKRKEAGEKLPLFGVPFAIKDTVDLAGQPTTAGCPAFSYVPERSALVVERLMNAGAIAIGKVNLDQFGTGLAGDRSPYGGCRNVFNPEFISGGSSSGSAVAVAAGLVSFAVATDTAGSGRVPAAANNIVGLKPTPGLLSTAGLVPSCASLDCITFMSLTVEDSAVLLSIAQGRDVLPALEERGLASFAAPAQSDLDFGGDQELAQIFQKALARLESGGARRIAIDYGPFRETGLLLYDGPWVAERFAALETFMSAHADEMYPVTREIIAGGSQYSAVDVFRAQQRLKSLRETCLRVFEQAEVLVVPTFPTLPKRSEVAQDSVLASRRLGTYTNFTNLLGLSALAVPVGFKASGLPVGFTLIGPAGAERRLCEIGAAWQRQLDLPLGATGNHLPPAPRTVAKSTGPAEGHVRVSVAGAHMQGQPFHPAFCQMGARFVRAARTAPKYRFFAFLDLKPPRPGLLQVDEAGGSVVVEIYDMPLEGFGRLVASVAPPLAIGTVELEDGESVKGFLCESCAARRARDITDFGGWISFRNQNSRSSTAETPASC